MKPYIPNSVDFNIFCNHQPSREWKKSIPNLYQLLYTLLDGKTMNYKLSPWGAMTGMSALARRIKDLRDHVGAKIEPADPKTPLVRETLEDGSYNEMRNYWMNPENIADFIKNNFGKKADWPKKESKAKKIVSAC